MDFFYKRKSKEINLLQAEAAHQRAKYKKLNKAFSKKKISKEESVIIYYTSDRNSSSISEAENPLDEYEKNPIAYD